MTVETIEPDLRSALAASLGVAGIDPTRLGDAELIGGGTQHMLLRLDVGGSWVAVRAPRGDAAAEIVRRERDVLRALAGTDVPHARLIAAVTDGVPLLVTAWIEGFNPADSVPEPAAVTPAGRARTGRSLLAAIASLGQLAPPASIVDRSTRCLRDDLDRIARRFADYEWAPNQQPLDAASVDRVLDRLGAHAPTTRRRGLVHGDVHLANTLCDASTGSVVALVDWELAAADDPLLDLASFLLTTPVGGDPGSIVRARPWHGFPDHTQAIAHYSDLTGEPVDADLLRWWERFAALKLAVTLEGTYVRAGRGLAPAAVGAHLHALATQFLDRAERET